MQIKLYHYEGAFGDMQILLNHYRYFHIPVANYYD